MKYSELEQAFGVLESHDFNELMTGIHNDNDESEVKRITLLANPGIDLKEVSELIERLDKIKSNIYNYLEDHGVY